MLDILIVDDENVLDIKACIQQEGSILKDKCNITAAYFALKIPLGAAQIRYTEKDTAISKIKSLNNIDIAFLDISFPKEVTEGLDFHKPLLTIIKALQHQHPHCQFLILSHYHTIPLFQEKLQIANTDIFLPSIPKGYKLTTLEEYNKAYDFLLTNRLSYILNESTYQQKKDIKSFLTNNLDKNKIETAVGVFSPESLFLEFLDDNNTIDKTKALEKYLSLIIDAPKINDKHWSKKSYAFKYGLKDYYYQYNKYFASRKEYALSTLEENAFEALKLLFNYLFKDEGLAEVNSLFNEFPEYKIRTKCELQKQENTRIYDEDMLKFINYLTNRLLTIGLYFGANASSTGINYLLQKNSYCDNKDISKHFHVYLSLSMQDQRSTEMDFKIETLAIGGSTLEFEKGDSMRGQSQSRDLLVPMKRKYDKIFNSLANYEKDFVKKICEFARKNSRSDTVNNHLDHILNNVIKVR